MNSAKSLLRKSMKSIIEGLPEEVKQKQSSIVCRKVLALPEYKNAQSISIFLNMSDEIQTSEILNHALNSGKHCFIPRYDSKSNHMDMVLLNSWEEYQSLPETKWKIKQPPLDQNCKTALQMGSLDLILVPGLAFTKSGHRLGRGRGYYDTYLSKCEGLSTYPVTVALAFDEQIVQDIPMERTDKPVAMVLSSNS